ncbi:MAG TPA: FAD-dependent oxidoreductase [Ktedonobacteraceae bacterium]|nr:FAD-dependent oxidoreductase [Ktedonobacteraceae bacterium]
MTELVAKSVDSADLVIIGNGIAGLTAAVEARRLAPDRRVVIITEQSHPTINTPALKQFAIGKLSREQLLAYPAGTEQAQFIHVINARAEEIHAQDRYITLKGGRGFGYSELLIAAGSTPTGLPPTLPGADFDGVLTLHRLYDYLDLRRRLGEVEEAVVIGGGAHAIETVMSLLYWGIRVHWLLRGDTFLSRMLDRPASDMVLDAIQRSGARVYTETEALGIVGRVGTVAGVVTNQQQLIPCQLVLVCTGTSAVTSLARHCDLKMKHKQGILVDDQLRTSVPHIYAAGDVAAIRDPQTGLYAPRAQWYAAVSQGRMAASSMTGSSPAEELGVPWHATRLGNLSMLTVGNVLQWQDTATTLTDSSRSSYRRIAVIDDRLVGYLSLGPSQPDSLAIKRIIEEGLSIRDIKKSLLKGTFDARRYFSHRRTHSAQRMVTTGKLPVAEELEKRMQAIRNQALLPQGNQQEEQMHLARALPAPAITTDPLAATNFFERNTDEDLQLFADPFVAAPLELDHVRGQRESIPVNMGASAREETNTDWLTAGGPASESKRPVKTSHIVESTLIKAPETARTGRSPSGSLWSYSSPLPAVKVNKAETLGANRGIPDTRQRWRKGQFKAPTPPAQENGKQCPPDARPSSSLWSYSEKKRMKGR